jgi:CHAD domain-containing protein
MAKPAFGRKFDRVGRRVDKRLKAYLEDPENEDRVHDVRVSVRRLEVMFSLLPKKARRRGRSGMAKYKKFLSANSTMRDYDIIAERLSLLKVRDTGLQNEKKMELAKVVSLGKSLERVPVMNADEPDEDRIDKTVSRLVGKIRETMPLVMTDESKVEELHLMRRSFRKLRYILDVLPPDRKKKCLTKLEKAVGKAAELEELQDLLGSIHDCDITIAYLRKKGMAQALEKESANRKKLYQQFLLYMKN